MDLAIRRIRRAYEMTQEELAEAVGCSPQTIAAYEHSQRRYWDSELLAQIAKALKIEFIQLFEEPDHDRHVSP